MPLLTYIYAFEAARTTAGGREANGVADAMQKVCATLRRQASCAEQGRGMPAVLVYTSDDKSLNLK